LTGTSAKARKERKRPEKKLANSHLYEGYWKKVGGNYGSLSSNSTITTAEGKEGGILVNARVRKNMTPN